MATKSQPISVRLSSEVEEFVGIEAKRTRRSKGSVLESLVDEALRARRFPGVGFRGDDWERRPWVIGTAFDVWQIVDAHRDLGSVEAMVAEGNLKQRHVRVALAYAESFPDEIDEAIAENRQSVEKLSRRYPFIEAVSADV